MHSGMRGLALYSQNGTLLASQGDAPSWQAHAGEQPISSVKLEQRTMRVAWTTSAPPGIHAVAALNIEPEIKSQEQFVLRAAALSIPSALIATLVGTLILMRGVILPIRRLRDELLARDGGHLPSPGNPHASIDGLDDVRSFVDQLTEARASAQAMAVLAVTDELTSLYTRRYFNDAFELQLDAARRDKTELSVAMIDVDRFKSINDTYGHAVGDEVLKRVARTCRETLRTGDVLARFGGEEFVVLLPNTGVEGVAAVAEKVRRAIEHETGFPRPVTVSVGTSTWCWRQDATGEALLRRADEALYIAKHAGRNRVVQAEAPAQPTTAS
jgi:diguanylate cyclase (GGDEF)-like protein